MYVKRHGGESKALCKHIQFCGRISFQVYSSLLHCSFHGFSTSQVDLLKTPILILLMTSIGIDHSSYKLE